MGYNIRSGEPLINGLRRIAIEQIDRAIGEIDDSSQNRNYVVHQVRKRCKKLRGLLRLVQTGIDFYACEDRTFRDAARRLSLSRDQEVMAETFALVMSAFEIEDSEFASIRHTLSVENPSAGNQNEIEKRLDEFRHTFCDARQRVEDWALTRSPSKTLQRGVENSYGRSIVARQAAREKPSPKRYHEWRKQLKYHWYHSRLLEKLWPVMIKPYSQQLRQMTTKLGTHHDLAVLLGKLDSAEDEIPKKENRRFTKLANQLQAQQIEEVERLSDLLQMGKPKCVGNFARQLFESTRSGAIA